MGGIAAGAEVNVNADWTAASGDSLILNKPTIPTPVPSSSVVHPPGVQVGNLIAVTTLTTGQSHFLHLGKVPSALTSCEVLVNVTTAAATITWAEVAIFTGAFPASRLDASLTRRGFTNVATTFSTTGLKAATVALSGVFPGDNLWAAYGSAATTPFQLRGGLANHLQFRDSSKQRFVQVSRHCPRRCSG